MKKSMKLFLTVILSLAIVCSLAVPAFAADEGTTIRNVNEAYALVHSTELIAIYKAQLYEDGVNPQDVYYVVCRGLDFTETDPNAPRSVVNAVKIGLSNENNTYVKTLCNTVLANVPAGEKVVFVGHSMGGMVIEQAIAQKCLKDNYDILYSMAIGSPYILTKGTKEGTLRRMVDTLDSVPYMSIPLLANPYMGEAAFETSYQLPLLLVHFRSYERGACWKKYDCLGAKNGSAYIVLGECVYQ